jgi:transposase
MAEGNIVGIDPHRAIFTATVLDPRVGELGHAHFPNTLEGHGSALAWANGFGLTERWGVEGASGLGRGLAEFLVQGGCDVRDVPPHKTSARGRGRHEGKSDRLDSHRVAAETQANPRLARAFKHAVSAGPDSIRDRMTLWNNARKSLTKVRVQLLGELDALVQDLPENLRGRLGSAKTISARVNAVSRLDVSGVADPTVLLRLRLIEHRVAMLREVLEQDKAATAELAALVEEADSTLVGLVGIAPRAAAEILVEVGDIRRFTEASFARFNGTAPIPASSGEGGNAPVRHRLSRGGNRRLNAAIYRIAMIQLRFEPRARHIHDQARANGHTRREAMRILKRHISNAIFRTMLRDARRSEGLT